MNKSLFFKQLKPITPKILGVLMIVLALFSIYSGEAPINQITIMAIIGVLLLGYSILYEICEDGIHFKHFKLFGITVIRTKFTLFRPDLIRVFPVLQTKTSDWGPIAAMGKRNNDKVYVIRLFNGNNHFTVFRTSSFDVAATKAERLGEVLNAEVQVQK